MLLKEAKEILKKHGMTITESVEGGKLDKSEKMAMLWLLKKMRGNKMLSSLEDAMKMHEIDFEDVEDKLIYSISEGQFGAPSAKFSSDADKVFEAIFDEDEEEPFSDDERSLEDMIDFAMP